VLTELGIDVRPGTIRCADIVVDQHGAKGDALTAKAPVLVAEVLSPSTVKIDLGVRVVARRAQQRRVSRRMASAIGGIRCAIPPYDFSPPNTLENLRIISVTRSAFVACFCSLTSRCAKGCNVSFRRLRTSRRIRSGRLRALALFGRRPTECVARSCSPASENLHKSGLPG
jgi:hypothetical protein